MPWDPDYRHRLAGWIQLRNQCRGTDPLGELTSVNAWWFQVPIRSRFLDRQDPKSWPDPWQLLADDGYCELARSLGMLYTILMTPLNRLGPSLAETDHGDLVLVSDSKYIMSYLPHTVVNIGSGNIKIFRVLDHTAILNNIGKQ